MQYLDEEGATLPLCSYYMGWNMAIRDWKKNCRWPNECLIHKFLFPVYIEQAKSVKRKQVTNTFTINVNILNVINHLFNELLVWVLLKKQTYIMCVSMSSPYYYAGSF